MIGLLKKTTPAHWIGAIYWTLLSSIGGLLPIWGGALLLWMFSEKFQFERLIQNGELALYSASIISASVYPLTRNYGQKWINELFFGKGKEPPSLKISFPFERFFLLISIIILVVSTLLFSGSTLAHLSGTSLKFNFPFLTSFSMGLFGATLIISYLITVLDEFSSEKSEEEVREIMSRPGEELETEFDELQKKEKEQ